MSLMRASRRQMLAATGCVLAGGAVLSRAGRDTSGIAAEQARKTIILQDGRHSLPDVVQRRLTGDDALLLQLEPDPVRQWRGASAALLAARTTRLLGVTRWPEFLLVRGLAEESGRRVRYQRLDTASGAIIWMIA